MSANKNDLLLKIVLGAVAFVASTWISAHFSIQGASAAWSGIDTVTAGSSFWGQNSVTKQLYYTEGNVGIGTSTPVTLLDINGGLQYMKGGEATVIAGSIDPAPSTSVTGVGTSFQSQLNVGDKIDVNGEVRTVTAITSNTALTVDAAFTDTTNDTVLTKFKTLLTLTGSINPIADDDVTGTGTLFLSELKVGDRIDVNGDVRTVTAITSNTALKVNSAFTDTGNDTTVTKLPATFVIKDANANTKLIIRDDGNVGIGKIDPQNALHVQGNIGTTGWIGAGCEGACSSDGNHVILYPNGTVTATSSVTAASFLYSSDERLKKEIVPLDRNLERLNQIQGVKFKWKDGRNNEVQIGLLAQEVEKQFPEVVSTNEEGYKAVDYVKLVPVLVEAIKEQQKEIEELKKAIYEK